MGPSFHIHSFVEEYDTICGIVFQEQYVPHIFVMHDVGQIQASMTFLNA